jgi:hypothetical protein
MDEEEGRIHSQEKNGDPAGEAWYAGINIPSVADSREICTLLMSYLGVGPKSKGVEYILSALEESGDNHTMARCLGDVMEYLANDPSDYYRRLRLMDIDYSTDHGFNHRAYDFYEALGIDEKGQLEVKGIVLEISSGIMRSISGGGRLTSSESSSVFGKMLEAHPGTDKKIIAAALYTFLTAPPQRPKTFGRPADLPLSL